MTKDNLAEALAAKFELPKSKAVEMVNALFDTVTTSLSKGEEVSIAGFGAFKVSARKARSGVNPRTGEKIQIAATKVPKFKAGKGLKDAVK
jgi:DNA-binding protein HU-beta